MNEIDISDGYYGCALMGSAWIPSWEEKEMPYLFRPPQEAPALGTTAGKEETFMSSGSRVNDAVATLEPVAKDREQSGRPVGAALIKAAIDLLKQERSLSPKR